MKRGCWSWWYIGTVTSCEERKTVDPTRSLGPTGVVSGLQKVTWEV